MFLKKVTALTKYFEDPKNPLLGPTLRGGIFFGLWINFAENKFCAILKYIRHSLTSIYFVTECIYLYVVRHDINEVVNSISMVGLSVICVAKLYSYMIWQKQWKILFSKISEEENRLISNGCPYEQRHMDEYIRYTRIVTYTYWCVVIGTILLMIVSPFIRYFSSQDYRQEIRSGQEPLPQIMDAWFPFNNNSMPGYMFASIIHVYMASQGAGTLAIYDMNAVAIMSYFKGQFIILREKCNGLFEDVVSIREVANRIKECHRHHSVLIDQYKMFNSLLSPTMFLYVLMCSVTICGAVIQFTLGQATLAQKIWIIQYTGSLVLQLFMYCWHSNEVTIQSINVDGGIYNSNWWRGNVRERRQLILLAGKLDQPFILSAGPFTSLSVPTFINIIKGAYSIYTLFTQMQE